jgi:hypothetical protein
MRKLLILLAAAGGLACQACQDRADVQREAREEALQGVETPVRCGLAGAWDVQETLSGGTCGEERLATFPLRIAVENHVPPILLSITRGGMVFEGCQGTWVEGCDLDVTCASATSDAPKASLQLHIAYGTRLNGREIVTYRDGVDRRCNVELELEGAPSSPPE